MDPYYQCRLMQNLTVGSTVVLYSYCRSMEVRKNHGTSFLLGRRNNSVYFIISLIHPELAATKLENLSSDMLSMDLFRVW